MPDPDRSRFSRLQPVLLVGGEAERDGAGLGDQHHLFELDAVRAAGLAGVALDAQGHADLELAVVAAAVCAGDVELVGRHDYRPLVLEAEAVEDRGEVLLGEFRRVAEALFHELEERQAGLQQLHVAVDVLEAGGVEAALPVVGRTVDHPRAGDVVGVTVRADQVGVTADDVALLDDPKAGLLGPRVRLLTRQEIAGVDPLAFPLDVGGVEMSPDVGLGDAGLRRREHALEPVVAGLRRQALRFELFGTLDGAGPVERGGGRR